MFEITGFRFRGPAEDQTRCSADAPAGAHAIEVKAHTTVPTQVLVDHLDIGYWKGSAIDVKGPDAGANPDPPNPDDDYKTDCPNPPIDYPREARPRAVGNFIHHVNPYGVVNEATGAFLLADANVFYSVRQMVYTPLRRTEQRHPVISPITI